MVFTMCHVCLSGELLWLDDLLHAHPQFGNILCGALLPSVMIESLRRRSANGERPSLRGEQCTAPVSGLCLDVKWMFGIEGWNEGFDLLRISLGMEFPLTECLGIPLE